MTKDDVNEVLVRGAELMYQAINHLKHELSKVRTGKASPALVQEIMVDYYGSPMPIIQVASVTTADSKTIVIQPWEKSMLKVIEHALFEANLGITPQNDGEMIRLTIPPLTEERRKDLVKQAKHLAEEAKVSIRNVRRDCMDEIKKMIKEGLPEDFGKSKEDEAQKMTNDHTAQADKLADAKEKDILTI